MADQDQEAEWGDDFEDARFFTRAKVEPKPKPHFDLINQAFAALVAEAYRRKDEGLARKLGPLTQVVYRRAFLFKHMQPYGWILTLLEIQRVIPELTKDFALKAVIHCRNQLIANCVLLAFNIIRGREAEDRSEDGDSDNGGPDNGGPNDGGSDDGGPEEEGSSDLDGPGDGPPRGGGQHCPLVDYSGSSSSSGGSLPGPPRGGGQHCPLVDYSGSSSSSGGSLPGPPRGGGQHCPLVDYSGSSSSSGGSLPGPPRGGGQHRPLVGYSGSSSGGSLPGTPALPQDGAGVGLNSIDEMKRHINDLVNIRSRLLFQKMYLIAYVQSLECLHEKLRVSLKAPAPSPRRPSWKRAILAVIAMLRFNRALARRKRIGHLKPLDLFEPSGPPVPPLPLPRAGVGAAGKVVSTLVLRTSDLVLNVGPSGRKRSRLHKEPAKPKPL